MDTLDKIQITIYYLIIGLLLIYVSHQNKEIIKQNKQIELKLDSIQKQQIR